MPPQKSTRSSKGEIYRFPLVKAYQVLIFTACSEEESLFSGAREELQLLKEAIIQYQQKTHPDPSWIIKVNEISNPWKDVREAVKVAKAREDGQDEDSWSARVSCDKIVDNISTFETWLDLLPGGDYGAVVGGVFKMVVTVWAVSPACLTESSHS